MGWPIVELILKRIEVGELSGIGDGGGRVLLDKLILIEVSCGRLRLTFMARGGCG